ncbi:MAG: TerC family protein, partial [Micrococcales bacterium]|nr:TerC family protein [Micrococcales bacterium]
MDIPTWGWYVTIALLAIALFVDVVIIARRPHVPSMGEAGRHLAFFIGLAVLFGIYVWIEWGGRYAGEFFAGWLTEYSLSVDNLFVFLLIMQSFRVPMKLQQSALMIGIVIAIILRGI